MATTRGPKKTAAKKRVSKKSGKVVKKLAANPPCNVHIVEIDGTQYFAVFDCDAPGPFTTAAVKTQLAALVAVLAANDVVAVSKLPGGGGMNPSRRKPKKAKKR